MTAKAPNKNLANMIPQGADVSPAELVRAAFELPDVERIAVHKVDPRRMNLTFPAIEVLKPGVDPERIDEIILNHPKGGDGIYGLAFYETGAGSKRFTQRVVQIGDPRKFDVPGADAGAGGAAGGATPDVAELVKHLRGALELSTVTDSVLEFQARRQQQQADRDAAPMRMVMEMMTSMLALMGRQLQTAAATPPPPARDDLVVKLLTDQLAETRNELRELRARPAAAPEVDVVTQVTKLRQTAEALGMRPGGADDDSRGDEGWSLEKIGQVLPVLVPAVRELKGDAIELLETWGRARAAAVPAAPVPTPVPPVPPAVSGGTEDMDRETRAQVEAAVAADREQVDVLMELLKGAEWSSVRYVLEEYQFVGFGVPFLAVEPGVNVNVYRATFRKLHLKAMELWPQFCEYAKWRAEQPDDGAV